jgi:hypothetical protein
VACYEFQLIFWVLRVLFADNLVLDSPWYDDEQASSKLGTTRVSTLMMDETSV